MHPIDLTKFFDISEDNTDGVRSVTLVSKPSKVHFILKGDQTLEEVVADPDYQKGAIEALLAPLKDAKSVILTGCRFGLQRQKMDRIHDLMDEIDSLKAELAALKG